MNTTPIPKDKDLSSLQKFQDAHDRHFHKDIYSMPKNEQLRHISQHLTKIAGRFADYFDKLDHKDVEEADNIMEELKLKRIPDSFIFSLMLANRTDIDLGKAYFERMKSVEEQSLK